MLQERSLPDLKPRVQTLLMLAARAQHVSERIRPWLLGGGVVICDRFLGSTLAYQGAGFGLSIPELEELNRFATAGVRPDATVLLDIDVRLGLVRTLKQRVGDWEKAGGINAQELDFHSRVRRSYLDQAEKHGWTVLDASRPRDELHVAIWQLAEKQIAARPLQVATAIQTPLPLGTWSESLALEAWHEALANAGLLRPAAAVQPPLPLGAWGEALVLGAWHEALANAGLLRPSAAVQRQLPLEGTITAGTPAISAAPSVEEPPPDQPDRS